MTVFAGGVGAGGGRVAVIMSGSEGSGSSRLSVVRARLGTRTRLSENQRLGTSFSLSPQVAVGADGTAVAAWPEQVSRNRTRLRVAIARPGQRFGPARSLITTSPGSAPTLRLGGVAVTPAGGAVVAWQTAIGDPSDDPVQVAIAAPGAGFGAPVTLGLSMYYPPSLAALPNGRVALAWLESPSPPLPPPAPAPTNTAARIWATTLTPGAAAFAPPVVLETMSYAVAPPQVGAGVGGAVVAWSSSTSDVRRAVGVSAEGAYSSSATVPRGPLPGSDPREPLAIGVEADGTQVALSRHHRERADRDVAGVIYSSVRRAGGLFSPPALASSTSRIAGPPKVASLPDLTFAAWSQTSAKTRGRVQLMQRPAGGVWASIGAPAAAWVQPWTVATAASVSGPKAFAATTWIQAPNSTDNAGAMYLTTYRP